MLEELPSLRRDTRRFYQCKVEMQAAVPLNEIDDVLDTFATVVADDQQEEFSPPEMASDGGD